MKTFWITVGLTEAAYRELQILNHHRAPSEGPREIDERLLDAIETHIERGATSIRLGAQTDFPTLEVSDGE